METVMGQPIRGQVEDDGQKPRDMRSQIIINRMVAAPWDHIRAIKQEHVVAFIGIQHLRLVEYITVRPGNMPPTALDISSRTTQGSMWGQSSFPCPLHTTFVKETGRDGNSLKACFVFQAMQKVSGRNCLHYTVGLRLNQIGCFISLFSHFLAYERSREKKIISNGLN